MLFRSDVATSLGVSAGLILVLWFPSAAILDPLIALGVAGHIALTGWELVRRSIDGLMDRALPREEMDAVRAILADNLKSGHEVSDLKSRRAGSRRFVEFSLRVPAALTVQEAHRDCDLHEEALQAAFSGMVVMIHVEPKESRVEAVNPSG